MRVPRPAARFEPERIARIKVCLTRLIEYGTDGYPPYVRTRLKISNVVAYLIAAFALIYAIQQALADASLLAPAIALNLANMLVALLVPFAHRFSDIAGAFLLTVIEFVALFSFTALFGTASGIHLQYFAAPAAFFVIFGSRRLLLTPWHRLRVPTFCILRQTPYSRALRRASQWTRGRWVALCHGRIHDVHDDQRRRVLRFPARRSGPG